MNKIKLLYNNRWVKFSIWSITYLLIFVIWSRSLISIIGLLFIYDYIISQYYKKLFWNKHQDIKKRNKSYNFAAGWIESIIFALVVASVIRTYAIEMYVIPSPSMENTLLVGDYIAVSKVTYGPKMPNTPIAIPLVHNVNPLNPKSKSYVDWIELPYKRLSGFTNVKRGDVIVFNYPQGDTVLIESPQDNYYALKRRYGKSKVEEVSKIIYHPVDKRDNYIKRAIGLPGDFVEVKNGYVFVNGKQEGEIEGRKNIYRFQTNPHTINRAVLEKNGIAESDVLGWSENYFEAFVTDAQASSISSMNGVQNSVRTNNLEPNIDVFPYDTLNYKHSEHNLSLQIPQKGGVVELNMQNLSLYQRIIEAYEGNKLEVKNSTIYINDVETKSYTFKMDYYFAMGDNRDNSLDSRFFGFVPEDHIVGKASFIWMSIDANKTFPSNIRFDRIGKIIKGEF